MALLPGVKSVDCGNNLDVDSVRYRAYAAAAFGADQLKFLKLNFNESKSKGSFPICCQIGASVSEAWSHYFSLDTEEAQTINS